MKRTILAIAALLMAANVQASDLLQIYREALARDAQYQSAHAEYQAAQEKLPQGRAGLLPSVTLSGVRRQQKVDTSVGPEVTIRNSSVTVTATQPIYRKENFAVYEQSKIQVAQADSQFAIAVQDLILRVAQAYFDALTAQVNVEVAEAQKKAIGEQLEQAKRNFEVGTATIVDTYEAQARFDLTVSQEIAANNDLEIRKHALQQIIGRFPDNLVRANESASDLLTLRSAGMEDWVKVAEENSLALKVQQAAYDIAAQQVERAKAGHYPTLDFVAQYSDQRGVGGTVIGRGLDLTAKEIGVQLSIPLFQGFAAQSRVREALANRDKALQDLDNTRRNIALQVRQQYLNVTNGIAQVKALKQALVSSQSQLDSTKLGQEVGVRTQVDVLNAQQQLYSARRDFFQALHSYLVSVLRLYQAAGTLTEQDVEAVNQVLR